MESDISTSNSPNANVTKGEESMDVCNSDDDNVDKEQKQETGTERNERLLKEVKSMQDVLNGIEKRNSVCSQWRGGSKFARRANVKFGAPKSLLDSCAPPPPVSLPQKKSESVLLECRRHKLPRYYS